MAPFVQENNLRSASRLGVWALSLNIGLSQYWIERQFYFKHLRQEDREGNTKIRCKPINNVVPREIKDY